MLWKQIKPLFKFFAFLYKIWSQMFKQIVTTAVLSISHYNTWISVSLNLSFRCIPGREANVAWYPVHCSVWRLWLDVCCSVPSDTEFPWRQGRPSASNEDMKRWTTALRSLHPKTPTMTSPAATALTAATASTPPPALHLPVRNARRRVLAIPTCLMRRKCLIAPLQSLCLSPTASHLHPQTA